MKNIRGMATGIGSLPHIHPDEAIELIFKHIPQIPFWPQLPKRSPREGMLAQFSENMPMLQAEGGSLVFKGQLDKDARLEEFYAAIIDNNLDYFGISDDFAVGLRAFSRALEKRGTSGIEYIKGQVTGPFTFSAGVSDSSGKALLHDEVMMQAISKGLAMKARWQARFLKKFGKEIIVFVDEPYLGCFGSAYTPITRERAVSVLSEFTDSLTADGIHCGVHCCGNTDWSIFTDVPGLSIINFDAHDFLDRVILYADDLKGFFQRGGILCWGIVPTREFNEAGMVSRLKQKIEAAVLAFANKGIDPRMLLNQSLISPSCGMGSLTIPDSRRILEVLSSLSEFLRK